MDDPHKHQPGVAEINNILPDVVHSQQIPAVGIVVTDETDAPDIDTGQNRAEDSGPSHDVEEFSKTESISEHVPSKIDYSGSESDEGSISQGLLKVETDQETKSSLNIHTIHSPISDNPSRQDFSRQSASWPDENVASNINLISEESPVNLALSSDLSKEVGVNQKTQSVSQTSHTENESESPISGNNDDKSLKSDEYMDSLNEESSHKSNLSIEDEVSKSSPDKTDDSPDKQSSGSEEIIKLDIRGQGAPRFPLQAAKIIFGPPPEGSTVIDANVEQIPIFQNLLSPFLVGAGDSVKVEEVFDDTEHTIKDPSPDKSLDLSEKSLSSDKEHDLLVEEVTVHDTKEREDEKKQREADDTITPPKSIAPEDTLSFSTLTTDYKTICEEYHVKLVHLEAAISQRDGLIEELTISLQRSVGERDDLRIENDHLIHEIQTLQHAVGERSQSDHDTIKAQLSDFIKYQSMIKEDSTKYFSALMSGGSSMQSSNGEKDMDREEITVNYSKSDLKSSISDDEFQTGFENKVIVVLNKFDEYIEENMRNKLRESLIQVLCDEIGKMRIETDTDLKEVESQMQQDKQAFTVETRRLRELLASVKAGNADIDALREELSVKHEKEMENLRTYFEKKCCDMERSYSEEVWRGRSCLSPPVSTSSLEAPCDAAGDRPRRRTRSADLPSLEATQTEQAQRQVNKKYDQLLEDMKTEQLAYINELQARHKETVASLEEQITQLKAHIQTAENTEANVSLYQQDIDLELEKCERCGRSQRLEEQVRREVVQQLQDQIQVLLSDPDAEVSSWPLELVALRDKIHGDARLHQEKELSSLRDELSGSEADKWRQRRNNSFDQNRQLEEVTKERDGLKLVAAALQHMLGQVVAYCARAEDELNRTVLAELLARLLPPSETTFGEDESRPSSPNASELNLSVSRGNKHVHFAPDLRGILTELDEEGVSVFLRQQRDLAEDIRRELDLSLRRLRDEAQELLDLSAKLAADKVVRDAKMLESSQVQITELVHELEAKQNNCDNCEMHKKSMEEVMGECLQRENLLRGDLEAAMVKIAQLMAGDAEDSADLIAEGYGTVPEMAAVRARSAGGVRSLDGCRRLAQDLETVQRDRDDLHQQLEAANRQLRSTRQFVEEQAAEREAERDEFARRLDTLRDENKSLAARLHSNARILNEVEQLETQTREMNQIISDLEIKQASKNEELKATEEKVTLLRDIIANLESQLEQKTAHETEILKQLEEMKKTIDERDSKIRTVLGELESLRSEKLEQSEVICVKCGLEENKYSELMEKVNEQCEWLEEKLHRRTQQLERLHDVCSGSCSEPSEDVSLRDQKDHHLEARSPERWPAEGEGGALGGVWRSARLLARAEDALLKRLRDLEMRCGRLRDVAQEVRAERDVLQARMSEQALQISSLSARLQRQRNDAEALAHHAASDLGVRLHDALAEVQRLKEELESKDKQLVRAKQNMEERDKLNDQHQTLYGNSCNPKDKVIILERELSSAQSRIAQLEGLVRGLEADKGQLLRELRDLQRGLAERDDQLQEMLALKLDEDNQKEKSEILEVGKMSARTLSDIVSISEFDEQDLQMRRAELKAQNLSLSGAPYATDIRDKAANRTLPPDLTRPNMSSLNIDYIDDFDLPANSPRADSLPLNHVFKNYKRNVNETTVFGTIDKFGDSAKHSTALNIPDNCSMYPNRNANDNKNVTIEPKKINFSLEVTNDNRTQDEEFTSLRELGITLDVRQENFPDILTQLKNEIKKSRTELETCKSELKNAEEQLCEFPALKEEVEELKGLLENTMATMETDKKFYENQLENFSSNKKLLEQRLTELTQEVNEKSKDLHLLKEDILRRENMILELAKEKRNLTNKMAELEVKIDELQSRNAILEKYEAESHQMREKIKELQKLEQLVSEKNQQIDSLNQHLDRLDDLQRCLNDKTEELDHLKENFEEKSNEVFQMQDNIDSLNRDVAKANEDNKILNANNQELKLQLTKLEKENENASLKLQNSESELERVNSLNSELTSKIEELKLLTDKLKDKETEIEILNEDINSFHEEIASLKEQLKMVSRSPSPRNKIGEEKKTPDRQASNDKKHLVKIRKQISLLQHELDFNKKELNDKAFELAKAKLDVTELKNSLSKVTKQAADKDADNEEIRRQVETLQRELQQLAQEKMQLAGQLDLVMARIREESNVEELKSKLREKAERCQELENELVHVKELVEKRQEGDGLSLSRSRSPTAELERALRDQLHYSHTLDDHIMEQILSASSDERDDIPRLALNTSKSSSSIHSSSSERVHRLRAEMEKLQLQVNNLQSRLHDKDALIAELNRTRDKLVQEWQGWQLRQQAERDQVARLQLLLDTQRASAAAVQKQDADMIATLKRRLESAMQSELDLQQMEQRLRERLLQRSPHEQKTEDPSRGEVSLLKCKLESERARREELQTRGERARARAQTEIDAALGRTAALQQQLADITREKQESTMELARSRELLAAQAGVIARLQRSAQATKKVTEVFKSETAGEMSPSGGHSRPAPDERDHAMRYLHVRCVRLESCRKALVWQKRYLQRVLAGYLALERALGGADLDLGLRPTPTPTPRTRFRCVVSVVVAVCRMRYLVRRREAVRSVSAGLLLRPGPDTGVTSEYAASAALSPPTRGPRAPSGAPPADAAPPTPPADSVRRPQRSDLRLAYTHSPGLSDFVRRSPYITPHEDSFTLRSPQLTRAVGAAYLSKLELVSQRLERAGECARDPA